VAMTGSDFLEDEPFYDAMQTYRHAPVGKQAEVVKAYEDVKALIRQAMAEQREADAYIAEDYHLSMSDFIVGKEIAAAIRRGKP
jgi:hypothetical protein